LRDGFLAAPGQIGLLVIEDAGDLTPVEAAAVKAARAGLGKVPVLALSSPSGPGGRARTAAALGLVNPVVVAGGSDRPGVEFEVRHVADERSRRRCLAQVVSNDSGLAIVLAADRPGAERLSQAFSRLGLRSEAVGQTMRTTRVAAAITSWRQRRLDVLVTERGFAIEVGRAAIRVLAYGSPPPSLQAMHDDLALFSPRQPASIAIVITPDDIATLTRADDDNCYDGRGQTALAKFVAAEADQRRSIFLAGWGYPDPQSDRSSSRPQ
jgi:hypothetical protein